MQISEVDAVFYSSITERTRSTNFSEMHNSATWTLCSLEARSRLNSLGLPYGRKSKTITPPRSEFSLRDYLRGIIDADGSVGYTGQGFPFISLTTASTAVGGCLSSYAQELTGTRRTLKRNGRDGIYNILYMKEAAQELAADLYYPGCLSLQRKQTAADSLTTGARPAGMKVMTHRRWDEDQDREAPGPAGGLSHQPFTQMNCFSFATISTRSLCCSIT
ncbi:LAGLIDADG family homing endonuclease [Streptomyces sp. NPDC005799]|uniref:LAGLIDADG family homing endonuclease n=1 Tax=Streptomyces sp. NPDC005799 TaxID=3154678 RepID=UPI00340812A8